MSSVSNKTFKCFGLVIHGYDALAAIRYLIERIDRGEQTFVVTANPEIMLEARRSAAYWETLHRATLRLVDGIALKFVGWLRNASPARVTGVDLAESLLQESAARGWKVALLGGDEGNADKAAWHIRKAYPSLSLFAERGGSVGPDGSDDEQNAEMLYRLTQFAPDVLLVGFGHPKQEFWISRHLAEFPSVKIAVGIGGTVDYWSGAKRRAPKAFRSFGLEWFWRLCMEPSRWRRIMRAVFVFPYFALLDVFHS